MMFTLYMIAAWGFNEGGWPFWQALWWPHYLAKRIAKRLPSTVGDTT